MARFLRKISLLPERLLCNAFYKLLATTTVRLNFEYERFKKSEIYTSHVTWHAYQISFNTDQRHAKLDDFAEQMPKDFMHLFC